VYKKYDSAMLSKENVLKRFGQNIKEARREIGMTQEELAANVVMNRTYMGRLERGESNPPLWTIYKIATALKKKTSELLDLKSD
jgi:DNA-binding XRE family transcriptional regulator